MKPLPPGVRMINLHGAEFWIPWEDLAVGQSFFIKTPETAQNVLQKLEPAAKFFRYGLVANNRCEFGYYGVRVWRLA